MLVEQLDQLGEVGKRPREPVDLVDHHDGDLAGPDIGQQRLQGRYRAVARKSRPDSTGKLGVVGFCFGGTITNQLAVRMGSDLDAAVSFYGSQASADAAAKIKAPLLAHYGE